MTGGVPRGKTLTRWECPKEVGRPVRTHANRPDELDSISYCEDTKHICNLEAGMTCEFYDQMTKFLDDPTNLEKYTDSDALEAFYKEKGL